MRTKRIHVNGQHLRANGKVKFNEHKPVFTVKVGRENHKGNHVYINGPSALIYSPDKPLKSGAKAWIETICPVYVDKKPEPIL